MRSAFVCLSAIFLSSVLWAAGEEIDWLVRMPSPERVARDFPGNDAYGMARRRAALLTLRRAVEVLSGKGDPSRMNPSEIAKFKSYHTAILQLERERCQGKGCNNWLGDSVNRALSFEFQQEVLKNYFPTEFVSRYFAEKGKIPPKFPTPGPAKPAPSQPSLVSTDWITPLFIGAALTVLVASIVLAVFFSVKGAQDDGASKGEACPFDKLEMNEGAVVCIHCGATRTLKAQGILASMMQGIGILLMLICALPAACIAFQVSDNVGVHYIGVLGTTGFIIGCSLVILGLKINLRPTYVRRS